MLFFLLLVLFFRSVRVFFASFERKNRQGFTFLENGNKLDTGTDFRWKTVEQDYKLLLTIVNYCKLLQTIVNNWAAGESKHSSAFLFWQIIWHLQYRQSKERESLDAHRVLFGSVRHAFRIVNIQYPRNKQQFSWKVVITLSVGRSCRLHSRSRTTRHQRAKERRQRWCHKVVLVSFTFTTSFRS